MIKRKVTIRKKRQNRIGMALALTVVLMLLVVVTYNSIELKAKQQTYTAKEADLKAQIEQEQKRTDEIAEFEKYTKTKKYVEEVAKDKLGLVYDGEIIFRAEQ